MSLSPTAEAIRESTAYGVKPTMICVALESTASPASMTALNGLTVSRPESVEATAVYAMAASSENSTTGTTWLADQFAIRFEGNRLMIVSMTPGTSRCW